MTSEDTQSHHSAGPRPSLRSAVSSFTNILIAFLFSTWIGQRIACRINATSPLSLWSNDVEINGTCPCSLVPLLRLLAMLPWLRSANWHSFGQSSLQSFCCCWLFGLCCFVAHWWSGLYLWQALSGCREIGSELKWNSQLTNSCPVGLYFMMSAFIIPLLSFSEEESSGLSHLSPMKISTDILHGSNNTPKLETDLRR